MVAIPRLLPALAVRPEDYGARGDDTNDDAAAIQAASNNAGVGGAVQFSPGRTYRINSTVEVQSNFQTWLAMGATIKRYGNGVAVRVGKSAPANAQDKVWHFTGQGGYILRESSDFTAGNVGLEMLNVNMSAWYDFVIRGFEIGLHVLGDGGASNYLMGSQYNSFVPKEIGYCKFGIYLRAKRNGWANGNDFFGGGRVGYYSNQPNSTGGYALYLNRESATSSHVINQNQFYALCLENGLTSGKPSGAVYPNCLDCTFHGLRYEGFDSPKINLDLPDCGGCSFAAGNELMEAATDFIFPATTDPPKDVWIHSYRSIYFCGGTATSPGLTLQERNSGSNPLLRLRNTNQAINWEARAAGGHRNYVNGFPAAWEGALWLGQKTWQPTEAGQAAGTIRAGKHACTIVDIQPPSGTALARKGDPVCVGFNADIGQGTNKDEGGLIWSGQVASDLGGGFNKVRVVAFNPTATDITGIASGTLTVYAKQAVNS
ncbi:MAG: glycoside hydrolase family 55 protein [Pirellulales bacterium]|nr:glycoside hydrolase family 55 protein [Pirellulales bacterium]